MQLHKKIWCIVMTTLISVSLAMPSYAEMSKVPSANNTDDVRVSKEQALQTARSLIHIPQGFFVQDIKLKQVDELYNDPKQVWQVLFANKKNEHLLIVIDSQSNAIKSYQKEISADQSASASPSQINFQQAKDIAMQWLKEIKYPYLDQLYSEEITQPFSHIPLHPNFSYSFHIFRKADGVPVPQQGVQMLISNKGEVVRYQSIWNENISFASMNPAITWEQATAQLKQRMPLVNVYKTPEYELGAKIPYIRSTFMNFMLDAQTGQLLSLTGDLLPPIHTKPLTEKPLAQKTTGLKSLSRKQIMEKVKKILDIPHAYHLESMQQVQSIDKLPHTEWLMHWLSDTNDGKKSESGSSRAITVKYREFNDQIMLYEVEGMPIEGGIDSTAVPFDKAKQTSIDFVKKQLPHLTHQLVVGLEQTSYEEQMRNPLATIWSFSFNRIVHGIISSDDQIQVYINKLTGQVERYEVKLKSHTLPQVKPKLIDQQAIREKLASRYEAQLIYRIPEQQASDTDRTNGEMNTKIQAKLAYRYVDKFQKPPVFLDGVDGIWRKDSTGVSVIIDHGVATDIQGHWAQRDMELMMYHDVFRKQDSLIFPDQSMTVKEILKMLVIGIHRGDGFGAYWNARSTSSSELDDGEYAPYIQEALSLGLIASRQEANVNQKATRIQFAELLVKALGFHKLASYHRVFRQGIIDIARTEQIGHAAIVSGLGIMELDQGEFKPDSEVTRAQASQMIVRFLQTSEDMSSAKK